MNVLGINSENVVVGVYGMPDSEVQNFITANPQLTVIMDTNNLGQSAMGMTYDPATGELSGDPYVPPKVYPTVSAPGFKILFTSSERIAIKNARPTDATIDDFNDLLEDPRTTQINLNLKSVSEYLDYLISVDIIDDERKEQILNGVQQ